MSSLPLADVRVLDLTQVLAGPYCTQMLADLGADVVRLEGRDSDVARTMPPHEVGGDSVYFLSINRSKRSIVVDLKTEEGRAVAHRLALASDVVIENFRPGVCERLGLSPQGLRREKPGLIWCSISGFGQDGPYRDKPAYDLIIQALSGGMSITGERDGSSVRAGIPIGDICAGMYASTAIVAALHRRLKTGCGEIIDISMLDCQLAMLSYQLGFFLKSGEVPGRQGREHDSIATYGTFIAGDGVEFVVAALGDRMWERLCSVLHREDLLTDPRFVTGEQRRRNRALLVPILNGEFAARTAEQWMKLLDHTGVPVGVVNTLDRVVQDPQIEHRGMIVNLVSDDGREVRVVGSPIKFADTPPVSYRYPPRAGEHSVEILKDILNMSDREIDGLMAAGAIRSVVADKSLSPTN